MKQHVGNVFRVYVFTWLFLLGWFIIRGLGSELSIGESLRQLKALFEYRTFWYFVHLLFLAFLILFYLFNFFRRVFQKKGLKVMLLQLVTRMIAPVFLLYFGLSYIINRNAIENHDYVWQYDVENTTKLAINHFDKDKKIRGMSVFGWHRSSEEEIESLVRNNVEWVAVVPFFYQKDETTKTINTTREFGVYNKRDSVFIKSISALHEKKFKVMLKPHLWVTEGWRSDLKLNTKKEWLEWFKTYRKIMLHYAKMGSDLEVELLCIGTELRTIIKALPQEWDRLIADIKDVYKGKLTYAANWYDEYEHVTFWDQLDYIGIQGYFPLTEHASPKLDEIKAGWKTHKEGLQEFSERYNKPILFTEIGYKSDASTTVKPWEWNTVSNLLLDKRSTLAQQLAYEALFQSLWQESWFSGMFIWQWDLRTTEERAKRSFDFSPRFKPAQNVIAKWFGDNSLHK